MEYDSPHKLTPQIVFVRFHARDRIALAMFATITTGVGVACVLSGGPEFGSVALAIAGFAWMMLIIRFVQRFRLAATLRSGNAPLTTIVEANLNLGRFENPVRVLRHFSWSYRRAKNSLAKSGIHESLCIVDERVRPTVNGTKMIHDLLEPEQVGEPMTQLRSLTYLLVGVAILVCGIAGIRFGGAVACPAAIFIVVAIGLLSASLQRWIVAARGSVARARGLVVGAGVVADQSRVWVCRDSLTVLRYESGQVVVTIMSETGNLSLRYLISPPDAFEEFWRRWMHPQPRPELAERFLA